MNSLCACVFLVSLVLLGSVCGVIWSLSIINRELSGVEDPQSLSREEQEEAFNNASTKWEMPSI